MPRELNELLKEMHRLEEQLESYWDSLRDQFNYTLKDRTILFERDTRDSHVKMRVGVFDYLLNARLINVLTAPVTYAMIFPIVLLDISFMVYQHICFRAYKIPIVDRSKYILAIDRYQLEYLNIIEKVNCVYCGYANGLISYVKEVLARTEQYWCPIKHARTMHDTHQRYVKFKEFGDGNGYFRDRIKLRQDFDD